MKKIVYRYSFPIIILIGFLLYFSYDIYTLKKCFTVPDYLSYYYPYRQWFSQRLAAGEFPLWNPFWGLGHVSEICSSFPIDLYTIFEIIFGPKYHYFQAIQFLLMLVVGFYAFVKLGFKPMVATAGAILYFMMPWVTYWYYFFWATHAFIGNILLFVFAYLWFKTENYKYLFFISWAVIFSMFGTKPEFWFFNTTLFVFYSFTLAYLFYPAKIVNSIKTIFLALLAMLLGISAHLWQLNILKQVMEISNRVGDHSFATLFSYEMYHNFFLSIAESSLIKMLGVSLLLYLAMTTKKIIFRILALSSGLLVLFWMKIWKFDEIAAFMDIKSPVFIGTAIGIVFSFLANSSISLSRFILFMKDYRSIFKFICDQAKTFFLFILFIYYWCRPASVPEISFIRLAPPVFQALICILVWLGCTQFWKNKLAKLAYFSVLFVFLIRENIQILLAYLFGIVWIPTRDTYLIDFSVATLAVIGLSVLDVSGIFSYEPTLPVDGTFKNFASRQNPEKSEVASVKPLSVTFKRRWLSSISPASLGVIGIVVFSASSNFYYSQPMMTRVPSDYQYYFNKSKIMQKIRGLRDLPTTRIFIINKPTISFSFGFDAAMLEGVSQITQYAGLVPKNYVDWALYKRLGIKPKGKWAGAWTGEIGEKITSKLPKRDTYGYSSRDLYILTVIVRPPIEKNVLKLLGVKYILVFTKSLSDPIVGYYDLKNQEYLDKSINALGLTEINNFDNFFYIARLAEPLPRAFLVEGVSECSIYEFMNEMDPIITDKNDIIKTKSFEFSVKNSASVERYEPEKVSITVDAKKDSYLILSDLYHPFWHAKLDGYETEIIPAFYILRAVKVPQGNHRIDFYCRIPRFQSSVIISVTIILLTLAAYFFTRKHLSK